MKSKSQLDTKVRKLLLLFFKLYEFLMFGIIGVYKGLTVYENTASIFHSLLSGISFTSILFVLFSIFLDTKSNISKAVRKDTINIFKKITKKFH